MCSSFEMKDICIFIDYGFVSEGEGVDAIFSCKSLTSQKITAGLFFYGHIHHLYFFSSRVF